MQLLPNGFTAAVRGCGEEWRIEGGGPSIMEEGMDTRWCTPCAMVTRVGQVD